MNKKASKVFEKISQLLATTPHPIVSNCVKSQLLKIPEMIGDYSKLLADVKLGFKEPKISIIKEKAFPVMRFLNRIKSGKWRNVQYNSDT